MLPALPDPQGPGSRRLRRREVVSCRLSQFGSGMLARTSDRTWQADAANGANTLTISFGHVFDSMCMCVGEFRELSAVVRTQVESWLETDTGRAVDVTSPDNVLIGGTPRERRRGVRARGQHTAPRQ